MAEVAVLLGAGASKDAGLPLSRELTSRLLEPAEGTRPLRHRDLEQLLNYVVSAMVAHRGRSGVSPKELPDIEEVISAVELLAERDDLEVAPFVQNWQPVVEMGSIESPAVSSFWPRHLAEGLTHVTGPNGLQVQNALKDFLRSEGLLRAGTRNFQRLLEALVEALPELLQPSEGSDCSYLDPLIDFARLNDVSIATLNYDLLLELRCDARELSYSHGLEGWNTSGSLLWPDGALRILKLHGSVDWQRANAYVGTFAGPRPLPANTVTRRKSDAGSARATPFVVLGRREKLRAPGPFLDLMQTFTTELRSARHLVIVGYSFGDPHVNEFVARWLNAGNDRKLTVVDPGFSDSLWRSSHDFRAHLLNCLRHFTDARRESLQSSRLVVLAQPARDALSSVCAGPTELDRLHASMVNPVS